MEEVSELKYLGFIISENASNVSNISSKKNKSIGTIRNIMNMIQGLGTYSIQNGLIYFHSLLRSSLLYAGETYYNLTERNHRMLENIEEDCLRQILKTGKHCSMSLLYLELGVVPARFQIQIMMLNFLQYILQQDPNSLIQKFFRAQCDNPTKNDWVSHIKIILKDTRITLTFEEIANLKSHIFKKIVDTQVKSVAMKYLLSNIKSKGKEIKYSKNLECQGYLLPNNFLTVHEQREIFSFRSRMNNLKYNFSDNHKIKEVCLCGEDMNNLHLYECKSLNNIEKNDSIQ